MKDSMENSSQALFKVTELHYSYPDGASALNGVNFSLNSNEKLAIVGPNGSGKSTLLLHLSGCIAVKKGQIILRSNDVGTNLQLLRKSVGLIFQEPDDQLFMPTVLEDVAFGLVACGVKLEEAHMQAMDVLEKLAIPHLSNRPPHRLSGGEKRMAALAGILVMRPEVLVMDEPSAALDPQARRTVINTLRALKQPMILATHDLDMALDLCARVLVMNGGKITAEGNLPDLLQDEALLLENGLELPLRSYCRRPE